MICTFSNWNFRAMTSKKGAAPVTPPDVYQRALKSAWSNPFNVVECFPEVIAQWISKKATELGVPCAYIAYPFLTGGFKN